MIIFLSLLTHNTVNKMRTAHVIFFSPTHTSEKIAKAISKGLCAEQTPLTNLTLDRDDSPITISSSVAIIAIPVYAGRVAPEALKRVKRLRGSQTPTILVAVYGNRDYEDALVELWDVVTPLGLVPLAAGAFVGEHSYSREGMPIAEGRPDATDLQKAENFGKECLKKLQNEEPLSSFYVKGNRPYRYVGPSTPAAPICNDQCSQCGSCIDVCPTGAISQEASGSIITDVNLCIKCCACVKDCPMGARIFDTPYTAKLHEMCKARREPELFL